MCIFIFFSCLYMLENLRTELIKTLQLQAKEDIYIYTHFYPTTISFDHFNLKNTKIVLGDRTNKCSFMFCIFC